MPVTETFFILLTLAGAIVWFQGLGVREAAIVAARQACRQENCQFLDDTVALKAMRPGRDDEGRLRLERVFDFEYSDTGDNRLPGSVALLGQDVIWLRMRPRLEVIAGGRKEP